MAQRKCENFLLGKFVFIQRVSYQNYLFKILVKTKNVEWWHQQRFISFFMTNVLNQLRAKVTNVVTRTHEDENSLKRNNYIISTKDPNFWDEEVFNVQVKINKPNECEMLNIYFCHRKIDLLKNFGANFCPSKNGLHCNTHTESHRRIHTYKYKLTEPVMGSKAAICIGLNE